MNQHKNINVGVLASGNGSNLEAIMAASAAGIIRADVVIAISDHPEAKALDRARKRGIPVLAIERASFPSKSAFEQAIALELKKHGVDLLCLAGFMRIIGPDLLQAFPGKIMNIHPSLLPAFPGLDAQRQALEAGVARTGCTVHFVDEKMDHGPIILQATVDIREGDDLENLKERILKEEHRIYPEAIGLFAENRLETAGHRVVVKAEATVPTGEKR